MNNAENKLSDIVEVMIKRSTPVTRKSTAEDIVTLITDYYYHRWGEYTWYASARETLLISDYYYDYENLTSAFEKRAEMFDESYVIYNISFVEDNFSIRMLAEVHLYE